MLPLWPAGDAVAALCGPLCDPARPLVRGGRSRSCGPCGLVLPVLRIVQGVGPLAGRKALDGLPGRGAALLAVGLALSVTLCGAGGPLRWRRPRSRRRVPPAAAGALSGPVAASAAVSMLGAAALFLHGIAQGVPLLVVACNLTFAAVA